MNVASVPKSPDLLSGPGSHAVVAATDASDIHRLIAGVSCPHEEESFMPMCNGCLVIHRDGTVDYCSEDLDGGTCPGHETPHVAGVLACRVSGHAFRCLYCDDVMQRRLSRAPDFVPEGLYAAAN